MHLGSPKGAKKKSTKHNVYSSSKKGGSPSRRKSTRGIGTVQAIPKEPEVRQVLLDALKQNALFKMLDNDQLAKVVDVMYRVAVSHGDCIVMQGKPGDKFFALTRGALDVLVRDASGSTSRVARLEAPAAFGEAFLYHRPRRASVKCSGRCDLWAIDRILYRSVMRVVDSAKTTRLLRFLSAIPLLSSLTRHERLRVMDAVQTMPLPPGRLVIKHGTVGSTFYILQQGEVVVTAGTDSSAAAAAGSDPAQEEGTASASADGSSRNAATGSMAMESVAAVDDGGSEESSEETDPEVLAALAGKELARLRAGAFFGERALLTDERRAANVVTTTHCVLLALKRDDFSRLLGPLQDILERSVAQYQQLVLRSVPALSNLSLPAFELVQAAVQERSVADGQAVVELGATVSQFYIVAEGCVEQARVKGTAADGSPKMAISQYYKGEFFGERELLSRTPAAYRATARGSCKLLCLPREIYISAVSSTAGAHCNSTTRDMLSQSVQVSLKGGTTEASLLSSLSVAQFVTLASDATAPSPSLAPELLVPGAVPELTNRRHSRRLSRSSTVGELAVSGGSKANGAAPKVVRWVRHTAGDSDAYALKCVHSDAVLRSSEAREARQQVDREKAVMAAVCVPSGDRPAFAGVVRFRGSFGNPNHVFLLTDYVPCGRLATLLRDTSNPVGAGSETAVRFYIACLVDTLAYLHRKGVLYRSLHPNNIVLDGEGYPVCTSFSCSKMHRGGRTWTLIGSPEYMAPELIACVGHDSAVDWWALGVLLYRMLAGRTPFSDESGDFHTYNAVLTRTLSFDGVAISAAATDLIRRLLTRDRRRRLGNLVGGANDIKDHPWFCDPRAISSLGGGSAINWSALKARSLRPPCRPARTVLPGAATLPLSTVLPKSTAPSNGAEQDFANWAAGF